MTEQHQPQSASPRWPVLATLVSLVLGAHLVVLAGGIALPWPGAPADNGIATAAAETSSSTARDDQDGASTAIAQRAAPVHVSTVRWIVPTPFATAEAAPAPAPPPKPKPVLRPAPPARVEPLEAAAPSPAVTSEPEAVHASANVNPLPPPIELHDEHAPPAAEAIAPTAADTPAIQALAHEVPAVETAPTGDAAAAATSEEPTPPDDMLLGAAASAKSRSTAATVKLPPAQVPQSMRLQYDVVGNIKGIGYRAEGLLDWSVSDGRYDARLEMRVMLLGSRSQTSTGRVGPQGLVPERFADKSRSEKATHFDAAQQRIRFSNNAPEVPLQAGAQDRLSLFMQLAGLLQARPQAYATGQTVNMQVAGTGDAPVWRFEVGEESTIRVPAGEFRVRHLVRQPRKEFDSTVEMWLAPSLGHMPVRLRITQPNGDVADQKLRQMP